MRPARLRASELLASVADCTGAEAFERLAPPSWLGSDARSFQITWICPACQGTGSPSLDEWDREDCGACIVGRGQAYAAPRPRRVTDVASLPDARTAAQFFADTPGVLACEQLAGEALARLVNLGLADAPRRVVWRLTDARRERGPSGPRSVPMYWATRLVDRSVDEDGRQRIWKVARPSIRPCPQRECWTSPVAELRAYRAEWKRLCEGGKKIPADYAELKHLWGVKAKYRDVKDPFAPAVQIAELGYWLEAIEKDVVVLVAHAGDDDARGGLVEGG